jgi:hypothetical protein
VLLLTHHQHVVDAARKLGKGEARIHELSSGPAASAEGSWALRA